MTRDDDELAFLLAHEFAHVLLAHRFGSEKTIEREADYLACYLAARGGYDVSAASAFWRRWAGVAPGIIIDHQYSHEGSGTRAALVEEAIREIERKRRAGAPLRPEEARRDAP